MLTKAVYSIVIANLIFSFSAQAQTTSQKEAAYFATLKAVIDYKINDENNSKEMDQLRQDEKFNEKLKKMMDKLQNTKSKDAKNKNIYNILRQAGKQIYDELN